MKAKQIIMPVLACCFAFGVCAMTAACGDDNTAHTSHTATTWEKDDTYHWKVCTECNETFDKAAHSYTNGKCICGKEDPAASQPKADPYTVTIEDNGASLTGIQVLFYSSQNSKLVSSVSNKSASAELPDGNYVVYLTGTLEGYIYTPIRLSATQKTGTIKLEAVTPDENGCVPYQILFLLEPDKILEANPEQSSGQVCTPANAEGEFGLCYGPLFNEFYILCLADPYSDDPFVLAPDAYEIHKPFSSEIPDGYTFDETKYHTPKKGGFCSVLFDKA